MLSLLDHSKNACYRVPYSLLTNKDPYVLAAYLASLRFSTRFNEATGTITQYLNFYGVKVDSHVGATIDRMRNGIVGLCEAKYLDSPIVDAKKLGPNQGFTIPFKPNRGWRYSEYPLAILFTISEIAKATKAAKGQRWTGADNLIDVLYLSAILRSNMDTPTKEINPRYRYEYSVATVDYRTIKDQLQISDQKMLTRLKRMKSAGLGVFQFVMLSHSGAKTKKRFLLYAHNTRMASIVIREAKRNLRSYYQGYTLSVMKG